MKNTPFSKIEILSWQKDYCMNFAIALSRITGWLIHIDYWANGKHEQNRHEGDMILLRVYVADNKDNIFDVSGIVKIMQFNQNVILPLLKNYTSEGGVATKFYGEHRISNLAISTQPDESKIMRAMKAIKLNRYFLEQIPKRSEPFIPAYIAAEYTFGRCSVYAEALQNLTKGKAIALIATSYTAQFKGGKLGYIHSLVLHPDGNAEDVWGIQTITEIAHRFGVVGFQLSEDEHIRVIKTVKLNSPKEYEKAYLECSELIRDYIIKDI